MNLVVLCAGAVPPILEPSGDGGHRVHLAHYPANTAYCLDEARHLADAGHRVWLADGLTLAVVPSAPPDAVYAPCHLTGDRAMEISRGTGAPALIRVVAPLSGDLPHDAARKNDYAGLLRDTRVIATTTPLNAAVLRRWVIQAEATTEVFVIPHAIDPPRWAVALSRGEAVTMPNGEHAEPGRTGAVYVGTNYPHKHVQQVIDVCAEAKVALRIVTSSPIDGTNGSARLDMKGAAEVLHHATDDEKWRALATARVCVTASENEAYWMPGGEALAVGTPFAAPSALQWVRSVYGAGHGRWWHDDLDQFEADLQSLCFGTAGVSWLERDTFEALGMTPVGFAAAATGALTRLVERSRS